MNIKLVVINGTKKNQVVTLRSEETIVGRQQGCDLRIPSPLVSRRHCRLSFLDNFLVVEDLASANGCLLNGVPVEGRERVRPGDHLGIGPVTFRVEYSLAVSKKEESPIDEDLPVPRLRAQSKSRSEAESETAEFAEEADSIESDVFAVEGEETASAAEAVEEEQALRLEEDFTWRAPSSDELRNLLSQMDKE